MAVLEVALFVAAQAVSLVVEQLPELAFLVLVLSVFVPSVPLAHRY